MKTYSDDKPNAYSVSGHELRIRWNVQEVQAPRVDDEPRMQWEANEAVCSIFDDRSALISKIIRSVYSIDDEIATINNQATKPDEYAAYQAFRANAKSLADGWAK